MTLNAKLAGRFPVLTTLGKHGINLLIVLVTLGVCTRIILDGYTSWRFFLEHSQQQSGYTAQAAVSQISNKIHHLRNSLGLFVQANNDLLQQLKQTPHDKRVMGELVREAKKYFPDHLGLVLVNAQGEILAAPGMLPGPICRAGIRQFAQDRQRYQPHLHNDTAQPHFDMMAGWGKRETDGILVLTFHADWLESILQDFRHEGQILVLTNNDSAGWPAHDGPTPAVAAVPLNDAGSVATYTWPVAGTRWLVNVRPHSGQLLQQRRVLIGDAVVGVTALLVAALIIVAMVESARRKRVVTESGFRKAQEDLESKVRIRTESLTLANQALEREIRERSQAQALMLKLSMAVEQTDDSVVITDRSGCIEYVNRAFERVTGYTAGEVVGKTPALVKSGRHSAEFYRNLWLTIQDGEVFHEVMINRRKSGELYYEEKTITPLKEPGGQITHFVSTGKDITERTRLQERLHHLSNRDALTGLPNRAMFMDRLNHALASARRQGNQFGLLFIDLDNFKNIVDTLGHAAGDAVLEEIGRRLRSCVRESDTLARMGGDEFALIMEGLQEPAVAAGMAQLLLEHMYRPCQVADREIQLTASIGITLFPGDAEDGESLTRNADAAMYRAKDLGRNNYQFFTAELTTRATLRMDMENRLRHALERGEFSLDYQPKINLNDGSVYGVEALLRWTNPELGAVGPDQFIPILEANGLIIQVGDWVLAEACLFARQLHDRGYKISLAVNLSARQIKDGGLADRIEGLLRDQALAPQTLELEITETLLIENMAPAVQELGRLNALGVRVSVDDFGTGYSSLGYLKRLPIDTLKVDRSFVRDLPDNMEDAAITSAIVALAHSLDLSVVAEGVETTAQAGFLRELGCEQGQGYLFSRPLAAEPLLKWLAHASTVCRVGSGL